MNTQLTYTPVDQIETIRNELNAGFNSGKLKSIAFRKYLLLQLAYAFRDNASQFEEALKHDLGRPILEGALYEVCGIVNEIMDAYHNVEKWAAPEKAPFHQMWFTMSPTTRKEAKGVVLIIGPFNYPIWCLIGPLASAIAAGNAVLLKPSEQTTAYSTLLTELIPKYLGSEFVRVVNGGIQETSKLLDLQWDHIMFTGSPRVGRVVAGAAVKHLTPVTLELGGKSPTVIDPGCDLYTSVRRITWGKFSNAGQTCIAPDYILVPRDFVEPLCEMFQKVYAEFWPPTAPLNPDNASHMITPAAYKRVAGLIAETKGKIILGGMDVADESVRFIPLTIVRDVDPSDVLMQEEIFGPVLPIVVIDKLEDSIPFINARPHPLALYVFSRDSAFKEKLFSSTRSGAAIANDCNIHAAVPGMAFGGTGNSGYGYNTSKAGFDTFTHFRASLDSPSWVDRLFYFRFPPYTDEKLKAVRKQFNSSLPKRPTAPPVTAVSTSTSKWLILLVVAILLTSQGRAGVSGLLSRARGLLPV